MESPEKENEAEIPILSIEGESMEDMELDRLANEIEEMAHGKGPSVEEAGELSTDAYEARIMAFANMAFKEFEVNLDRLAEPKDPTVSDIIRHHCDDNYWIKEHNPLVQKWLRMKNLLPKDEELRDELIEYGVVKKKVFYRRKDKKIEWDREKKKTADYMDDNIVFWDQHDLEVCLYRDLKDYIPKEFEPPTKRQELQYIFGYGAFGIVTVPSKLQLIYDMLEGHWGKDDLKRPTDLETDLIIDWLKSDDGDEQEKRYRALVRVRLSGVFSEERVKHEIERRGITGKIPRYGVIPMRCLRFPYRRPDIDEYEADPEWCKFVKRLESGETSEEFSELSDKEKEAEWETARDAHYVGVDEDSLCGEYGFSERDRRRFAKEIKILLNKLPPYGADWTNDVEDRRQHYLEYRRAKTQLNKQS